LTARLARFYHASPEEVGRWPADFSSQMYHEMRILDAQEALRAIETALSPNMRRDARERVIRSHKRTLEQYETPTTDHEGLKALKARQAARRRELKKMRKARRGPV
tara:strand:+ start:2384 stop:2701 length:318 start_codon:yes stop_codon:yes gene_type:complete